MENFWRVLKIFVLVFFTLFIYSYVVEHTKHFLTIPQDEDGEAVLRITDTEIEDEVNDLLKVPLRLLPREVCLTNNNHVFSDDVEVESSEELPDIGRMNLFIEKDGKQVIEKISVRVEESQCRPVKISELEGATTTANYIQAALLRFEPNSDGSVTVIGGHPTRDGFQVSFRTDVSNTKFWVGLSYWGRMLLLVLSFFAVAAIVLSVVELLKRVWRFVIEDQFLRGF